MTRDVDNLTLGFLIRRQMPYENRFDFHPQCPSLIPTIFPYLHLPSFSSTLLPFTWNPMIKWNSPLSISMCLCLYATHEILDPLAWDNKLRTDFILLLLRALRFSLLFPLLYPPSPNSIYPLFAARLFVPAAHRIIPFRFAASM